jgi:hypothetical protein
VIAGVDVKNAGVPELFEPKATGFADLSQADTKRLVSTLHSYMLHAVDLMGVGSNVPVLDNVAEDRSSISGFASTQPSAPAPDVQDYLFVKHRHDLLQRYAWACTHAVAHHMLLGDARSRGIHALGSTLASCPSS